MMNTASATDQSPKSGSSASVFTGTLERRPDKPPTAGCLSANQVTANVPLIVNVNWSESVTSTPQSPLTEAKKIVMMPQTMSVRSIGQPSTTLAIFAAARFTVAMIAQLKK